MKKMFQAAFVCFSLFFLVAHASLVPRSSDALPPCGQWKVTHFPYKRVRADDEEACREICIEQGIAKCTMILFDASASETRNCELMNTKNSFQKRLTPFFFSPGQVLCAVEEPKFIPEAFNTEPCQQVSLRGTRVLKKGISDLDECKASCEDEATRTGAKCTHALFRQSTSTKAFECHHLISRGTKGITFYPGEGACPIEASETGQVDENPTFVRCKLSENVFGDFMSNREFRVASTEECSVKCGSTTGCSYGVSRLEGEKIMCRYFKVRSGSSSKLILGPNETACKRIGRPTSPGKTKPIVEAKPTQCRLRWSDDLGCDQWHFAGRFLESVEALDEGDCINRCRGDCNFYLWGPNGCALFNSREQDDAGILRYRPGATICSITWSCESGLSINVREGSPWSQHPLFGKVLEDKVSSAPNPQTCIQRCEADDECNHALFRRTTSKSVGICSFHKSAPEPFSEEAVEKFRGEYTEYMYHALEIAYKVR